VLVDRDLNAGVSPHISLCRAANNGGRYKSLA
jgi:hypothetical protein